MYFVASDWRIWFGSYVALARLRLFALYLISVLLKRACVWRLVFSCLSTHTHTHNREKTHNTVARTGFWETVFQCSSWESAWSALLSSTSYHRYYMKWLLLPLQLLYCGTTVLSFHCLDVILYCNCITLQTVCRPLFKIFFLTLHL